MNQLEVFMLNKMWVAVMVTLFSLFGCHSPEVDVQPKGNIISDSPMESSVDNNRFSVSSSIPQQVEMNEEFTISAFLQNETEQDFTIESRQRIFYFTVKDSTGKNINTIVLPDMGIRQTFPESAKITEQFTYRIKTPGVYSITAVAEFTVNEGDSSTVYKMETEASKLEVIGEAATDVFSRKADRH
ncbi:hypothetical protein [Paenibacillus fonticola]|uniref:hypothetical protein n=1 Tax=Paenibacillus fonticola TaxID=379896 RepID=UPI0003782A55|nr:hypothetical protein [Paenibacillus fonticola]